MMNIPEHPDIACILRTGYPPVYSGRYDEDDNIEEEEKKRN